MRERFIARMTEHDVLLTGTIKIMHRFLAVAARLLALVGSLALRHPDVHTVRRVIRPEPITKSGLRTSCTHPCQ